MLPRLWMSGPFLTVRRLVIRRGSLINDATCTARTAWSSAPGESPSVREASSRSSVWSPSSPTVHGTGPAAVVTEDLRVEAVWSAASGAPYRERDWPVATCSRQLDSFVSAHDIASAPRRRASPLYQPSFSVQIQAVHAFFHAMLVAPS